ncbi:F-box/LRR-repeat protein 13-like [Chenopodium quinoa]|uniref:F-box/LRR-repeat protein 13-like n=1 Tax=Chenopodium quinoa TaxID=63459 RepID=UPI000B79243B|nr:F-box/LRR-repeat protein 13-like [Chenopodium quinoa]
MEERYYDLPSNEERYNNGGAATYFNNASIYGGRQKRRAECAREGGKSKNVSACVFGGESKNRATKSAVKTCVLSKRWKKVWTQVSVLDFTEVPEYYHPLSSPLCNEAKICYNNFVSKVLVENNTSYLQRFRYEFSCDDDSDNYESWLNAAKKREYFELDLNLTSGGCQSYRFLELICEVDIKLPISPRTTGLDETLNVESLTLKSLEIRDTANQSIYGPPSISIKAPNLEYLSIEDEVTHYMVDSLALLTEANLNLSDNFADVVNEFRSNYDIYQGINYLISKGSKVSTLRLITSESLVNGKELPTFENLTHLEVKADDFTCELLQRAPKLKSLIFEKVEWIDDSLNYLAEDGCASGLEHVTVSLDNECQVDFVAYILKAATTLKEMTINLCCPNIYDYERAILQELLTFPRSSPFCRIEVVFLREIMDTQTSSSIN